MRKFQFETGKFYHIYNRGVDKREVFLDEGDYGRFLKSMQEFNRLDPIGSLAEKAFSDKLATCASECNSLATDAICANDANSRKGIGCLASVGPQRLAEFSSESNSLAKDAICANDANSRKGIGFLTSSDSQRFATCASECNSLAKDATCANDANSRKGIGFLTPTAPQRLVDFIAYCLNPNHYHLVLRQLVDDGISKFMHKLSVGYTNYFNLKNDRSGALFQGKFKSVQIDSEEHLLWVSVYVNGNAQIHGIIPDAIQYEWCGYPEYLGKSKLNICNKGIILDKFKDVESFQKASEECFVKMKERKDLQKYLVE